MKYIQVGKGKIRLVGKCKEVGCFGCTIRADSDKCMNTNVNDIVKSKIIKLSAEKEGKK